MSRTVREWWHGETKATERPIRAVVPRTAEKTAVFVEALVPQDFGDDEDNAVGLVTLLYGRLSNAVSEWARRTPEGRRALTVSGFNFHIGDLGQILDMSDPDGRHAEGSLEHVLRQQQILALRITIHTSDEHRHLWDYDDRLFDDSELGADFFERPPP